MLQVTLLGFSLALDCFAVSISQGLRGASRPALWSLALLFGLFQGGMLVLGYGSSLLLEILLKQLMPWIAAGLLGWIGLKMIREGLKSEGSDEETQQGTPQAYRLKTRDYLILSVATSIDALAAGVSLPALGISMFSGFFWVAGFSMMLSMLGGILGVRWGNHLGQRAEIFGGIVLCLLGLKALLT